MIAFTVLFSWGIGLFFAGLVLGGKESRKEVAQFLAVASVIVGIIGIGGFIASMFIKEEVNQDK